MEIEVDNRKYEILIASSGDGMGCELWDLHENRLLIEIFRNDVSKELQFSCKEVHISLAVLETMLQNFDTRIGRDFK